MIKKLIEPMSFATGIATPQIAQQHLKNLFAKTDTGKADR